MTLLHRIFRRLAPEGNRKLNPLQAFGYRYAGRVLALAVRQGALNPAAIRRVCDFGTGTGGSALALLEALRLPETALTLLEEDAGQVAMLRRLFKNADIHPGDGLQWLSRPQESYDLITAFMLGPDFYDEGLTTTFLKRALPRLSPSGSLLVCSDAATMRVVKRRAETLPETTCHWLLPGREGAPAGIPITVIISRLPPGRQTAHPPVPELPPAIIRQIQVPDSQGNLEPEEYPLSTPFERDYLQATITAFDAATPRHPVLPLMRALLEDVAHSR